MRYRIPAAAVIPVAMSANSITCANNVTWCDGLALTKGEHSLGIENASTLEQSGGPENATT